MNNYEFCTDFALRAASDHPDFKVLDYGCGAGEAVALMRGEGLDACGCDPFYEGGDLSGQVSPCLKDVILTMESDRIPFPGATFDLVVSNQVIEHVVDLDIALSEIRRVLKPGGLSLHLFPHREVWREGHSYIPLLHRFPKGSTSRIYYALAWRLLGVGYNKAGKTPVEWSRNFCLWLDNNCFYRPRRQIEEAFSRHLSAPRHIDSDWLVKRKAVFRFAPRWFRMALTRKVAGLVLVSTKPTGLTH